MQPAQSGDPKNLVAQELGIRGMNAQVSPYLLGPGQYQDILNSTFDPVGAITSRKGYTKYSDTAFGTYNTGTATFTKDSATVSGDTTLWETNCLVRGLIHIVGEDDWYEIKTIGGETSITLDRPYEGETQAGASYLIIVERVVGMVRYYKKDGTKKFLVVAGEDLWNIPDASPHTPAKVDADVDFGPNSPASLPLFGDRVYIADGINNLRVYDASALKDAGFAAPAAAPTVAAGDAGDLDGSFYNVYTFVFPTGESNASAASTVLTISQKKINWSNILVGPTGCTARNLYRTKTIYTAPTAAPTAVVGAASGLTGQYRDKASFLYAYGESACSPQSNAVDLVNQKLNHTNLPIGGATCIGRKIYRTKAGGSVFYYVTVIMNNVDTSLIGDFVPDALLYLEELPGTDATTYYLMDTIDDNETTTYTGDNTGDYDLKPETAPSTHNVPPTGFAVVRAHQDRLFGVGVPAEKNWLYYSEHLCGDIWEKHTNSAWHIPVPTDKNEALTALIPDSNDLLVAMASRFDLLQGVAPSDWRRTAGHQQLGTPAPNGAAFVENGVFIPSLIGIYAYQAGLAFPVSEPVTPLLKADRLRPAFLKYAAAIWKEHRYYLAYADDTLVTGINSCLLLFETKHRLWSRNTGICASHFCVFDGETDKGEVFFADPRDGYIYQMNQGETDNGTPIEWGVKTRPIAYERAGLGIKKMQQKICAFVKASDGDLLCEYSLDDGSFVEAGTKTLSGGTLKRYDFNVGVDTRCEAITVRFSSSRTSQLIFYGFLVLGRLDEGHFG